MSFSHNQLALLIVLVSASIAVLNAALSCPDGQTMYGNRCYKVYRPSHKCRTDFNFTAAEQFCHANNGELASIHSQLQQDFVTALIKKDQKAAAKNNKCGCHSRKQDYAYWIGLQLSHSANGSVNGASWTDNTPVNYGNPTGTSFRPPFVDGAPEGSLDDGGDSSAVCPLGNEKECVQVLGFGKVVGKWTDKHCNDSHTHEVSCSCDDEEEQHPGNSTTVSRRSHKRKDSSSSSEDDLAVDQCQLEAAHNGFICQYCPAGWRNFQGHCYRTVAGPSSAAQFAANCAAQGSQLVSIHSAAENAFVLGLAQEQVPSSVSNLIGLNLVYDSGAEYATIQGVSWSDGTPVNFGNPLAPGFAPGQFPWSPAGQFTPQPDNKPPFATCVTMWAGGPGSPNQPAGTWDDTTCASFSSATCKL